MPPSRSYAMFYSFASMCAYSKQRPAFRIVILCLGTKMQPRRLWMHQTYETKCAASSGRIIMRLINNNNSVSKLFRHWLARVRPAAVRWIYQTIELAILRTLAYTPLCPIDAPAGFFFCRNTNAGEADLTFRPKS